jgi:galactose mutarotase-like enzyme
VITERAVDSFSALTLSAPGAELDATFVPAAGMVGCSLRHRGDELLGQRGGLRAYVAERGTMGIPLLHPWANRLARMRFAVAGREVDLDAGQPPPALDPNGLPIHGLLAAAAGWRVEWTESTDDGGTLAAGFDFGADEGLLAAFPFPHRLALEATLTGSTLTITTAVRASGETPVPISFGFHPYFRLPGIDRSEWVIEAPVGERLALDGRMLPTGAREPTRMMSGRLGERTFDDGYVAPDGGAPFALTGGGRRIEVTFDDGYPFAQVYAPADDDVVAIEPMTAPTNALVAGGPELRVLAPGATYEAGFSITVETAERTSAA